MDHASINKILIRIQDALQAATDSLAPMISCSIKPESKGHHDPVTQADRTANRVLFESLMQDGEAWLSEESTDDLARLEKEFVWVVDPLDGTREFLAGIPEWCISVGFVENGRAVAGGISNPVTGEVFLGGQGHGVCHNGKFVRPGNRSSLTGAVVLASRTEMTRGDWEQFAQPDFLIRPMGSAAYKLALVAAGLADATWTLTPKHEWDVAAGVALVEAGGGSVSGIGGRLLTFNNPCTLLDGLFASGPSLRNELGSLLNAVNHR